MIFIPKCKCKICNKESELQLGMELLGDNQVFIHTYKPTLLDKLTAFGLVVWTWAILASIVLIIYKQF